MSLPIYRLVIPTKCLSKCFLKHRIYYHEKKSWEGTEWVTGEYFPQN